jgi:hypothetical protein
VFRPWLVSPLQNLKIQEAKVAMTIVSTAKDVLKQVGRARRNGRASAEA